MSLVSVDQAAQLLRGGEVVAIPTETVYGLAARIDIDSSLRKIFTTKARPFFDPLIVHVNSIEQARSLTTDWHPICDYLAAKFWPGPLTFVLPKHQMVSDLITSGLETVAIRQPRHPLALKILTQVGVPLAAPSANRFGKTSPTTAEHVESEFQNNVPVVDGGPCEVGLESTVLEISTQQNKIILKILRPGGVSQSEIESAMSCQKFPFELSRAHQTNSPGHLKAHYQPEIPMFLVQSSSPESEIEKRLQTHLNSKEPVVKWLSLPNGPIEAARLLYANMRYNSRPPAQVLLFRVEPHHSAPEWEAVMDRLKRAASDEF